MRVAQDDPISRDLVTNAVSREFQRVESEISPAASLEELANGEPERNATLWTQEYLEPYTEINTDELAENQAHIEDVLEAAFARNEELVRTETQLARNQQQRQTSSHTWQRVPEHDRRIRNGDDFAGDAWRFSETGEIKWTVVGGNPYLQSEANSQQQQAQPRRPSLDNAATGAAGTSVQPIGKPGRERGEKDHSSVRETARYVARGDSSGIALHDKHTVAEDRNLAGANGRGSLHSSGLVTQDSVTARRIATREDKDNQIRRTQASRLEDRLNSKEIVPSGEPAQVETAEAEELLKAAGVDREALKKSLYQRALERSETYLRSGKTLPPLLQKALEDLRPDGDHNGGDDRISRTAALAPEAIERQGSRDGTEPFTSSGIYTGKIVSVSDRDVIQKINANQIVYHKTSMLDKTPLAGTNVTIAYTSDRGHVRSVQEKVQARELGLGR